MSHITCISRSKSYIIDHSRNTTWVISSMDPSANALLPKAQSLVFVCNVQSAAAAQARKTRSLTTNMIVR